MTEERQPLVLIADDDGVTRAMVRSWLERSGYDVAIARDGDEALAVATAESPDLLLLDVTMPGLDGYEVCRAVQAGSAAPPPIIFLTAHGHTDARVAGLDAGAVDYVVKPFAHAELIARVRAALRTKTVRDGLVQQAIRDGLTGLINRRQLDVQLSGAVALAQRHQRPLSCLMLDIDHFKQINDRFGHAAGDEVLRQAADRITSVCRSSDVVGRYGGEEFVVVLPEAAAPDAVTTGDKLRRVLSELPISCHGVEVAITASVGAAVWAGQMTPAGLYGAADHALYRAKELGRNRTELFQGFTAPASA